MQMSIKRHFSIDDGDRPSEMGRVVVRFAYTEVITGRVLNRDSLALC